MGPRGISLELPFGVDFMKFGFKKKKICSKYTSTPLSRKHELLMSIVCIYVQSTTTRKTSLPMDDGLGLANELERGPRAGTGAQPQTGRFHPHRRPGRGAASSRAALPFRSLLRARAAKMAPCQLWLVSCFGFVVRVAVQVSQQRFAVGQRIRGQQLPNLLHCLLISHFLLFQGPD